MLSSKTSPNFTALCSDMHLHSKLRLPFHIIIPVILFVYAQPTVTTPCTFRFTVHPQTKCTTRPQSRHRLFTKQTSLRVCAEGNISTMQQTANSQQPAHGSNFTRLFWPMPLTFCTIYGTSVNHQLERPATTAVNCAHFCALQQECLCAWQKQSHSSCRVCVKSCYIKHNLLGCTCM